MIAFDCPDCGAALQAVDDHAARPGVCPTCQRALVVPGTAPVAGDDATVILGAVPSADVQLRKRDDPTRAGNDATLHAFRPAAPSDVPSSDDLGHLDEYKLIKLLGQGGMGKVFQAIHTKLEKIVAIKVLAGGRLDQHDAVARFEREMKAVGRLDHPHIVRALDAGETDHWHYLVMEFVEGHDLAQVVRAVGPLPIADACELARQAAFGLQEAHEHGMVHRDVKPSNLMLSKPGRKRQPPVVKVLDLGLALFTEAHAPDPRGLTNAGAVMGTLDYMAPEQGGDSHALDIRADVYSLGATLFKLLTGTAPYETERYDTPVKKLMALAGAPVPDLAERRADVPAELAQLVASMLAKAPDERPATPEAVAAALEPFCVGANLHVLSKRAHGEQVTDDDLTRSSITITTPIASPRTRPTVWLAVVGTGVALAVATVAFLLMAPSNEPKPSAREANPPSNSVAPAVPFYGVAERRFAEWLVQRKFDVKVAAGDRKVRIGPDGPAPAEPFAIVEMGRSKGAALTDAELGEGLRLCLATTRFQGGYLPLKAADRWADAFAQSAALTHVNAHASDLSDLGMEKLARSPALVYLNLDGCGGVSGDGLMFLTKTKSLRTLELDQASVESKRWPRTVVQALLEALPECRIQLAGGKPIPGISSRPPPGE